MSRRPTRTPDDDSRRGASIDSLGRAMPQCPQAADQALFAIVQGGMDVEPAARVCRGAGRPGFPRLCVGRIQRRRDAGTDASRVAGLCGAAAGQQAALSHGRRPADRFADRRRGGHRHVRLRVADAQWPQCVGVHSQGPMRLAECVSPSATRPHWTRIATVIPARTSAGRYLHHLFAANEMLGPTLLSLHNIAFYLKMMEDARAAIRAKRLAEYVAACLARWEEKT